MSRILLIGGTGFIGRSLLSSLSSEHTITVVARSLDDKSGILSAQPNITFFSGFDICHPQTFSDFFARHDIVINLAGLVSFHQKDREKLMNINYQGTLNIIAACEKNKIQKLIHVSSTAALGFSDQVIDENFQFSWSKYQRCVYSYSKFLAHEAVRMSSCPYIIISPSLVLGPDDKTHSHRLLRSQKSSLFPIIAPSGSNSYVDVRDLASAIQLVASSPVVREEFIVSSQNYSYKELFFTIATEKKIKPLFSFVVPLFLGKLLADSFYFLEKLYPSVSVTYENIFMSFQSRRHSSQKLRRLGWSTKYTLQDTIRDIQKFLNNHPHE